MKRSVCGKRVTVLFSLAKNGFEPSLDRVKSDLKVASARSIPHWKLLTLDTGC